MARAKHSNKQVEATSKKPPPKTTTEQLKAKTEHHQLPRNKTKHFDQLRAEGFLQQITAESKSGDSKDEPSPVYSQ
jgi:tRNA A37 N6-isopentenylltransferase MiaA